MFDVDCLLGIFDFNYQPVVVTFGVENGTFAYQIGRGEVSLHLGRAAPDNPATKTVPKLQGSFSVGVLSPTFA